MALTSKDTLLSDIVALDPTVVPVINRFGIKLGTGDNTIASACTGKNLDPEFLLAVLNTFLNGERFPEDTSHGFKTSDIISYLTKTDRYYRQFQLPNIHRHFQLLIEAGGDSTTNNIGAMYRFYQALEHELLHLINHDLKELFPAIAAGESVTASGSIKTTWDEIADRLTELKNMFIQQLAGDYDPNLCYALLLAIIALENDLRRNNRIRTFLPK